MPFLLAFERYIELQVFYTYIEHKFQDGPEGFLLHLLNNLLVQYYVFLILFSFCSLPMFSLILAHTNDYIPKEKFVAAGAGLQFVFGLGAMSGPFLCSIFMDIVGSNGFFIFLIISSALYSSCY